jgi:hypothetical protein
MMLLAQNMYETEHVSHVLQNLPACSIKHLETLHIRLVYVGFLGIIGARFPELKEFDVISALTGDPAFPVDVLSMNVS